MASQHNRADIIAGVDLNGSDYEAANFLIDFARQETGPRSEALATALLEMIEEAGAPLNKNGKTSGFFGVKSVDTSVLVEVGFLSSINDRANLQDPEWCNLTISPLAQAIIAWNADDMATRPLVRQ